jgi:dienelactone hydrolase
MPRRGVRCNVNAVLRPVRTALTRATAAIDRGVVRVLERRMAATAPTAPDLRDARPRMVELAAIYSDGTLGLPSRFFPEPPAALVASTEAGSAHGAPVHELTYASSYRPFLPAYRPEHHRWIENHTVRARHYRHPDGGARPVMVCLHGWGGGAWWLEERAFAAGYWLARGFDVVLFQLPFHGARAPGGVGKGPRSGALFPSANLVRTNEGFGQAIHDLRALAGWLRGQGAPAVGAMGMSLGGYTTALWATIDPQLAFAVAMIPAVSMSDLMWRHGEESAARRRAAQAGVSEELIASVFAVHAPLTRKVLLPPERLRIVAGLGDAITPADQARTLHAHWQRCPIHWFPGGHLAQVGRGDAMRAVRLHLAAAGLGRPPRRSRGGRS